MATEIKKRTCSSRRMMNRKYLDFLKEQISPPRFKHSVRVGKVCDSLARYFDCDPWEAWCAGLLHDCAREKSIGELKDLTLSMGIDYDDFEMDKPVLLHGKVGSLILKKQFPELADTVLAAVRYHVRGRHGMSDLEKIVYIGDFIEPGRPYFNPGFMDWTGIINLEGLFLRVERTISLYYKNKGSLKKQRSRQS